MTDNEFQAARVIRQRDIVPPEKLAKVHMVIIGVGAGGRQLAIQAATMGVMKFTLIDHDIVNVENLGAQGFRNAELGVCKVFATENAMREINPAVSVTAHAERYSPKLLPAVPSDGFRVVFSCVDDMDVRAHIWKAAKLSHLFVDGRMSAEVIRVLAVFDSDSERYYPKTLFSQSEAYPQSCTAKTTIYCASISAGLMLSVFTRWLRGFPIKPDMMLSLLSGEMTHDRINDEAA